MKAIDGILIVVTGAAIGLGVGFALRSKPQSPSSSSSWTSSISPTTDARAKPFTSRTAASAADDSPLATQLQRDLSLSSGVTRWLYWLEALEKAGPADFPRLVRLAQGNSTALRFVAARWVEVDPRHMFETIAAAAKDRRAFPADELAQTLFAEWPKRDLEGVIAALNEPDNRLGSRSGWRMTVATAVFDKDVERGLRLMSEWNIENYGPNMKSVAKWAGANPRHAAEFALEHSAGYASRLTMETIGKEWAKTDPGAALAFATSRPGELGSTLATAALKEWAGRNLQEAGEWLVTTDDRTRNRLSPVFVEAWAKQDANGALAWCESNLTGSTLVQSVAGVLKGAAGKDVASASAMVTAMYPSPARAEAAAAVAEKAFPGYSPTGKPVAPETLAWLVTLDGDSLKRVLDRIHWRWSESDPKSLADFLATTPSEHISSHLYSSLARNMARKDPAEALAWASQLPTQHAAEAGRDAFNEWLRTQPETALKWLNGLGGDDPRRESYFRSFIQILAYDPQAPAQVAQLTPAERATARDLVQSMTLPEDRRTRLLGMLRQ